MAINDKVVDWTTLKAIRSAKNNTPFQYVESSTKYDIWVQDGTQVYTTEIWIDTNAVEGINVTQNNTDKTDWETNYKAGARGLVPTDVNVQNTVNVSGSITADTSGISELVEAGYVYCVAGIFNMQSSGQNNPLIYFVNPSGSGKKVRIISIRYGIDVENIYGNFIIFANPTVSANGTSITPVNRCIGGGFGASVMQLYKFPTVSTYGSAISNTEVARNSNSVNSDENFSICLKPNNALLITGDPKSNSRNSAITVVWAEETI